MGFCCTVGGILCSGDACVCCSCCGTTAELHCISVLSLCSLLIVLVWGRYHHKGHDKRANSNRYDSSPETHRWMQQQMISVNKSTVRICWQNQSWKFHALSCAAIVRDLWYVSVHAFASFSVVEKMMYSM